RWGPTQAASDRFKIIVHGRGGHGAGPHSCIDPIVIGARIVEALQPIVSRGVSPLDSAGVSAGSIHAGTAINIIPASLELAGTIRTHREAVREKVHAAVQRVAEGICAASGARAEVILGHGYPALANDERAAKLALRIATEALGPEK